MIEELMARWCATTCCAFFIFSGQALGVTSIPSDQIPTPSVSILALLGLAGVLGAVIGALVNPTQPDKIESNQTKPSPPLSESKITPKKQECMPSACSSTNSAHPYHDEKA